MITADHGEFVIDGPVGDRYAGRCGDPRDRAGDARDHCGRDPASVSAGLPHITGEDERIPAFEPHDESSARASRFRRAALRSSRI